MNSGASPFGPRAFGWHAAQLPFFRVVEQRKTAQFRVRQAYFPQQEIVVFARERREVGIFGFILRDRDERAIEYNWRIVEDVCPEDRPKFVGVRRVHEFVGNVRGGPVIHLMRREQRARGLFGEAIRSAVAIETT